jgi:hypothetical protein
MRPRWMLPTAFLCLLLSGCLLLPSQTDLMLALLKPLVGFDPNVVNLFEQPIIKKRMTALLGARYDSTMRLLRTANTIKREGALYFVVSRYTPIPEIASKAGLVWNADTNQMAVGILKGDSAEMLFEVVERGVDVAEATAVEAVERRIDAEKARVERRVDATVGDAVRKVYPSWPHEVAAWLHPEKLIEQAIQREVDKAAARAVDAAVKVVTPPPAPTQPATDGSADSVRQSP